MATEIKAPTFPESVAEGTVAAWHKKPGDSVERDELIVEIETDKVVLEVVAPEAGTLTDVMAEEGDTVESEQVLGKIGEGNASASKEDSSSKESASSDSSTEKTEPKAESKPAGGGKKARCKSPPASLNRSRKAPLPRGTKKLAKRSSVTKYSPTSKPTRSYSKSWHRPTVRCKRSRPKRAVR